MTKSKYFVALAYICSIILGNLFVMWFGIGVLSLADAKNPEVVYFSLVFPLGAMWIGLNFSFRDFVQRMWGHGWVWLWMGIACGVTWMFNWKLALASVSAFVISESVDWFVHYNLRHKSLKTRLIVSNCFSCPLDSIVFVLIAFGWLPEAMFGQAIVKYAFSLLALPLVPMIERAVRKIQDKEQTVY